MAIELINFALSSRIQTLRTSHASPMIQLDYAPDSRWLLSSSADLIQLWHAEIFAEMFAKCVSTVRIDIASM